MILTKKYYEPVSLWKRWMMSFQKRKFGPEKNFKVFKLHKTEWPNKLYFYSPRLKRQPIFIGTPELLSKWQDSKSCETICPTQAIKVTATAIIIDDRGCISCGLCVEYAPEGLLAIPTEIPKLHRS